MIDMNLIIAQNINHALTTAGKRQEELAIVLGCSAHDIRDMLSGVRPIIAPDLQRIAVFCNTNKESLVMLPERPVNTNAVLGFINKVKTEEAKNGILVANRLIDMYLFHSYVNKQGNVGTTEPSSL